MGNSAAATLGKCVGHSIQPSHSSLLPEEYFQSKSRLPSLMRVDSHPHVLAARTCLSVPVQIQRLHPNSGIRLGMAPSEPLQTEVLSPRWGGKAFPGQGGSQDRDAAARPCWGATRGCICKGHGGVNQLQDGGGPAQPRAPAPELVLCGASPPNTTETAQEKCISDQSPLARADFWAHMSIINRRLEVERGQM